MTDQAFIDKTRRALFNTTALRYDRLILPAFGPLARRLVELAALKPAEPVLDLETGTGAVAQASDRQQQRDSASRQQQYGQGQTAEDVKRQRQILHVMIFTVITL